jgi:hypothetical protein
MDEFRVVVGNLGANGAVGNGIDLRSSDGDYLIAGNRDGEAAGIRTIERANTCL